MFGKFYDVSRYAIFNDSHPTLDCLLSFRFFGKSITMILFTDDHTAGYLQCVDELSINSHIQDIYFMRFVQFSFNDN
jgi:hypothetical protein